MCAKEFVDAVKHHMPHLLQRRKTRLLFLVQCMNEFGPSSAFNAKQYVSKACTMYNNYHMHKLSEADNVQAMT